MQPPDSTVYIEFHDEPGYCDKCIVFVFSVFALACGLFAIPGFALDNYMRKSSSQGEKLFGIIFGLIVFVVSCVVSRCMLPHLWWILKGWCSSKKKDENPEAAIEVDDVTETFSL